MSQTATLMQIDLQNLFYAARHKGHRIDFEKIWQNFSERESEFLTESIVYMIRSTDFNSSKFEKKLESIGYKLKIKNSSKLNKGKKPLYKQSNHDVNIVVDCLDKINSFDKWILMSGDGDFADLCRYLKNKDKKIEVWSFQNCYNSLLEPHIDKIHFIEEEFFYKKPNIKVFGFNYKGNVL